MLTKNQLVRPYRISSDAHLSYQSCLATCIAMSEREGGRAVVLDLFMVGRAGVRPQGPKFFVSTQQAAYQQQRMPPWVSRGRGGYSALT
jgi:hypothetical protein